jgi:tape measure domain-containing protein
MAANALIGALRVTLGLDSAAFEQGMSKSARVAKAGSAEIERSLQAVRRGASALKASLAGAITVGGTMAASRAYLDLADKAKLLQAQLKLATAEHGNLDKAQQDTARIAADTRVGLEATTALYTTMWRAAQPLGKTQDEAARATETFGKALKIGGAGAAEASSATLQFSQALASGVLRGDEFNSIAEASPRILQLLADALGVTRGELRGMAEEGKLTADVLFRALTDRKFTAGIDAEFRQLPTTFAEAMTLLDDAAIKTFGAFDRGGAFSEMIVGFVGDGVDGFADLEKRAEELGINVRADLEGLRSAFFPMRDGALGAFDSISDGLAQMRADISQVLGLIDSVRNAAITLQRIETASDNDARRLLGWKEEKLPEWSTLQTDFNRDSRRSRARGRVNAAVRRLEAAGYEVPRDAAGNPIESGIRRRATASTVRAAPASTSGGKKAGKASGARKRGAGTPIGEQVDRIRDSLFPDKGEKRRLEKELDTLGKALASKALPQAEYDRLAAGVRAKIANIGGDGNALLDKIMPEQAEVRRIEADLAALDRQLASGMVKDPAVWRAARDRLSGEYGKAVQEARHAVDDPTGVFANLPTNVSDRVLDEWAKKVPDLKAKNAELRDSFAETTRDISYSLQGLADDLRSGDWLDILSGALDLGLTLGGAGVFGKSVQTRLSGNSARDLPGFATGGSFRVGGAPGVDKNLIAFRATRGEMVDIRRPGQHPANDNRVARVEIVEHPAFASRVVGISDGVSVSRVGAAQRTAARRGRQRLA